MGRKSGVALSYEDARLQIIHNEQTKMRRRLAREMDMKKATRRLPGEEPHKKNLAIFLKLGIPGISYREIAARIDESKATVKKWFVEDAYVKEQYEYLQANLKETAVQLLQFYVIEAIETLVLLMRFGSEKLMKESAIEILDRVGIAKLTKSESEITNTKKYGWEDQSQLLNDIRQLPPEKQEEAIAGLEHLQRLLAGGSDIDGKVIDETDDEELKPIIGRGDDEDDIDEETV